MAIATTSKTPSEEWRKEYLQMHDRINGVLGEAGSLGDPTPTVTGTVIRGLAVGSFGMLTDYDRYRDYKTHRGQVFKVTDISNRGERISVVWPDGNRSTLYKRDNYAGAYPVPTEKVEGTTANLTTVGVGSIIEVTNTGNSYTAYSDWANRHKATKWKKDRQVPIGKRYTVVKIAPHSPGDPKHIMLVEDADKQYQYIIKVEKDNNMYYKIVGKQQPVGNRFGKWKI